MAEANKVSFQRKSLYREVWATPLRTLAKGYSISDVGLRKICSKLNIPLPRAGFWTKVQCGHKVAVPPLPPLKSGEMDEYVFTRQEPAIFPATGSEAHEMIASEKEARQAIGVAERLVKSHPLVAASEAALKAAKPDEKGMVWPHEKGCLDMSVSPAQMNRALRILDALLKAVNAKGYAVSTKDENWKRKTSLVILGESVEFGLRERYRQQEVPVQKHSWREFEHYPSGILAFAIKSWTPHGLRTEWSDGKTQRLEDCVQDIFVGLIRAADGLRQWRIKREEEEHRRNEERKRRMERAKQRQEELERFQGLQYEVRRYHEAEQIRTYVAAVREMVIRRDGQIKPGGKLERWIEWALSHADRLDPLVDSPPSIIDEPEDRSFY